MNTFIFFSLNVSFFYLCYFIYSIIGFPKEKLFVNHTGNGSLMDPTFYVTNYVFIIRCSKN